MCRFNRPPATVLMNFNTREADLVGHSLGPLDPIPEIKFRQVEELEVFDGVENAEGAERATGVIGTKE